MANALPDQLTLPWGDTRAQAIPDQEDRARLRGLVYSTIKQNPRGITADECAEIMREGVLSIRPRVSELHADNLIFDTGARRKNRSGKSAIVWRVREAVL
jgi:hypothetical protein